MTIIDIIRQADIRQPNSIDTRQKLRWLWALDKQLGCEMPRLSCPDSGCAGDFSPCDKENCTCGAELCPNSSAEACPEGGEGCSCGAECCYEGSAGSCPKSCKSKQFSSAPYESGSEKPLLDERWEELYCHYLVAQISAVHGETERYNRAIALYNSAYSALVSHYLRCGYRPRSRGFSI